MSDSTTRFLYDLAREITDSVFGEGSYAKANKGNPDPGVQEAIKRTGKPKAEPGKSDHGKGNSKPDINRDPTDPNDVAKYLSMLEDSLNATNVLSEAYKSHIIGIALKISEVSYKKGKADAAAS